ncbi:ABC transporter ATP-binding protein [Catellatospora chokoriensis]|uniref:ABC transporter ATP-binding protein n=1 Tax=Catellatospora chokoriensis TaxID=310353 RepID=A0A8J3K549_9ACTN|nr:sn-glycerol-3-phosphate ABC transporter ATP-binding protein UgpC [Catellatospora chokoriensis]GIF92887.1 ABC transporter ATP-binding protein [Catellatospora chokoriensis]
MAEVALAAIGKRYADGTRAVENLSLQIADGEFLVLVGPSGCGKSTALRMIAGLEDISEGTLRIGDRVVNRVPARDRDVAMVFQSYALYPHLDVYDNIGFGLRLRGMRDKEIAPRVNAVADTLGLTEHLRRRPASLSGGQRQRVAMGRAMVREPAVYLMDEPLSNLDAKLRVQMRAEIGRITRRTGVTTVYVTHDQTEAMTLGDRVAVMRKGLLQQVAAPQELYDNPVNMFVAGFIGSPPMNLVEGVFTDDGGVLRLALGEASLRVDDNLLHTKPGLRAYLGRRVVVGVRAEDLRDAALDRADEEVTLIAEAELTEALGSDLYVHFSLPVPAVVSEDTRELARDAGAEPQHDRADRTAVVARFSPRSTARAGDRISVAVDTARLHVFDADTGRSIH